MTGGEMRNLVQKTMIESAVSVVLLGVVFVGAATTVALGRTVKNWWLARKSEQSKFQTNERRYPWREQLAEFGKARAARKPKGRKAKIQPV